MSDPSPDTPNVENQPRYQALAEALLAAPDPVMAIAHELGDQAGRIDALSARLRHVEAALAEIICSRTPA